MEIAPIYRELGSASWYRGQVVHVQEVPPRAASYAELQHHLNPGLEDLLADRGLSPLYTHQVQAIEAALDGQDVAVVTPAASGKSLCYNVPVVQALLTEPASRAIYLFPTKALAQDQLRALREIVPESLARRIGVFDGDTPQEDRPALRRNARAVITNPDMLHFGMLPNHRSWARFLAGLRYIVVDEAHAYRGVFGSHVANVLRRLYRLCRRYGSTPQFICCSATIANPVEFFEKLIARPVTVVDNDGSPFGGKSFAFWNPPLRDDDSDTRESPIRQTTLLLDMLMRRDVRTLAFVRTRRQAELVYISVRDRLQVDAASLAKRLRPYRASYLMEDRREVEQGLVNGDLLAVVATNALELGVDIGDLDATILTGYPGSIASTWQQAGRSGRRGSESLSVLVGQDNPLDQYLMRHPDFFFGRPHEHARIRPENPYVAGPHLQCAAYEMPLGGRDAALFGDGFMEQVETMEAEGVLHQRAGRWHLSPSVEYPAQNVNIRSAFSGQFMAVEMGSGRLLERVDEGAALNQLHVGAVYLHQGEAYMVDALDLGSKTASMKATDAPYYTESRELTDIRVLKSQKSKQLGGVTVHMGEVEVSKAVVGYRKRALYSDEKLGDEPLDLPIRPFRTVALWFDIPAPSLEHVLKERLDLAGGLHAMEHAAIGILPLFAICDRNDIGGVSTALHPDTGGPVVFIYDGHPGGVGIAEHGYDVIEELWEATLQAIAECQCESGCPSCIQSPKCGNNNQPLDKEVAAQFLQDLLQGAHP
jgi:DEAD/DEAH box helicase domain-containing protein